MQLKQLTTPQNVLVPPPTRLHKMKGPPITYFGKYGLPKPFRPLSRTRHALQVSPFFKIPRELRNEIYALVVVSKDKLHLTKDHACQYDQFYFQICPAAFMNEYGECECESDLRSRTARFLDTSLLMVSQQIRTETLTVLFARNPFHLWEIMLHSLIITFSKFIGSIRNISVKMFLGSQVASAATRQIQRSSWKALSSLHRLTIYVQLEERGNEHYEEGILNNFRPLAFCHPMWLKYAAEFRQPTTMTERLFQDLKHELAPYCCETPACQKNLRPSLDLHQPFLKGNGNTTKG